MGRFWMGVGILLVFLALGLWIAGSMDGVHQQICTTLDQAAQQTVNGDLDTGIALAQQAQERWQHNWHATAAVADHEPMDEIDSLFAQLELYGTVGRQVEFAAYCTRLSQLISAVGEAHTLTWWNLL